MYKVFDKFITYCNSKGIYLTEDLERVDYVDFMDSTAFVGSTYTELLKFYVNLLSGSKENYITEALKFIKNENKNVYNTYLLVEIQGVPANQIAVKLNISREAVRQLKMRFANRLIEISEITGVPLETIKLVMLGKKIDIK